MTNITPFYLNLHSTSSIKIGGIFQHDLDGRLVSFRELTITREDGLRVCLVIYADDAQCLLVNHSNVVHPPIVATPEPEEAL